MIPSTPESLPRRLRQIREEVARNQAPVPTIDMLRGTWEAHVTRARQEIQGVHVEAEGENLYLGELSTGCRACKEGTWDCIFMTMRCNLDCEFCLCPHSVPKDYVGSVLGSTREQIAESYTKTHVTGISFSGGEPFLDTETLYDWLDWFKSRYPQKYFWAYTNGALATETSLRRLGELGLDEIRFNTAATGYDQPVVMENLKAAARFIPHITVEIPAIPEDTSKLLACLGKWCDLGVKYLNLHELMYERGSNSENLGGKRQSVITGDGHHTEINPESRPLTLAVMKRVQDEGLPLFINDCSLQSKVRQLRGRRRCLAPLVSSPYEKLVDDAVLESYCAYGGEDEVCFFHPDSFTEMRQRYDDYRFVRLVRVAPLSPRDHGGWIAFEEL